MATAYIVDVVRTPRGRGRIGKGALSHIHPQELLAQALNRLAERTGIDKRDVEDVIAGCVTQAKDQGADIARMAVLAAGYMSLGQGSLTLAPVLLVTGYCVLIPASLLVRGTGSNEGE